MLVSAIGQMMAMQNRFQAEQNMVNNFGMINSMMNGINSGAFAGANLRSLHEMDKKLQLSMVQNRLNYQVAKLQEEYYAKKIAEEFARQKRLDTIA